MVWPGKIEFQRVMIFRQLIKETEIINNFVPLQFLPFIHQEKFQKQQIDPGSSA